MNRKIKYLLSAAIMLLVTLCFEKNIIAYSINTGEFQANWNTVVNNWNVLCSAHDKSFGGRTYKFRPNGNGIHSHTNDKESWILSEYQDQDYSYSYAPYSDKVQIAWWVIMDKRSANDLYNEACTFETFRKNYTDATFFEFKRSGNKVEYEIKGTSTSNDSFGGIKEVVFYDGSGNELCTKTGLSYNALYEVDITSELGDASRVYAKVTYYAPTAWCKWQTYNAYKVLNKSGKWVNPKSGGQTLSIYEGDRDKSKTKTATSKTINLYTDISLQKYITKVNGQYITNNRNAWLCGANYLGNTNGKRWNAGPEEGQSAIGTYKDANPVIIEKGDIVTYSVILYNNTGVKQDVEVTDSVALSNDVVEWQTSGWNCTTLKNSRRYTKTVTLGAYSSKTLEVNIKFNGENRTGDDNNYTETKRYYRNKVWISGTIAENATQYRVMDADYVIFKKYKVSLEKYVSGVQSTGKGNTNLISDTNSSLYNTNLTAREGHTTYTDNQKNSNHVQVEIGDTVTYTIIIRNTATDSNLYGSIKVDSITDYITVDGTTYDVSEYLSDINCSNGVTYSEGKFSLNTTIAVNGEFRFTVSGKVNISRESSNSSIIIPNTAEIEQIKNENGVVTDSDGATNNKDSDWIETKTYNVSLKKYISNVSSEVTNSIDTSAWEAIREYIGQSESKYDSLKSKVGEIDSDDMIAAVNNTTTSSTEIEEYIKYDLNNDGKVTRRRL